MLKKIVALGIFAVAVVFAQSAHAAGDKCSVAKNEWVAKEAVVKKLEGEGWAVRKVKVEDGCYEAYAVKGEERAEVLVNPKTLEVVSIKKDD